MSPMIALYSIVAIRNLYQISSVYLDLQNDYLPCQEILG